MVQIRTVWWIWRNFTAPGGQEIVVAALWGCALSCNRWTPLIIVLVSFAKQPPWVSVQFPTFIIELRCEKNQQSSLNIAENSVRHFPFQVTDLALLSGVSWKTRVFSLVKPVQECFTMFFIMLKELQGLSQARFYVHLSVDGNLSGANFPATAIWWWICVLTTHACQRNAGILSVWIKYGTLLFELPSYVYLHCSGFNCHGIGHIMLL